MLLRYKRDFIDVLSFKGKPLRAGRHKIHPYPAMLHPLLVDYLLEEYAKENDVVFDPFCGTGVTLLQASIKKHKTIGFDINPLALLIAKTKTQRYKVDLLKEFKQLKSKINSNKKLDVPEIHNREYWYKPDVVNDLARIKYEIKQDWKYQHFFLTCLAFTCRNQCLTRQGEFKRYRLKDVTEKKNKVFDVFFKHTENMIDVFLSDSLNTTKSSIYLKNSEDKINSKLKYNLVITSPPYGDSSTTVAYGQFSSFGAEWINNVNPIGRVKYRIDSESLGKKNIIHEDLFKHPELVRTIEKIKKEDQKRSNDVLYFFNGYYKTILNIVENLEEFGKICFVVGNRNVKGCQIPMDQITSSFFCSLGLKFEKILVRKISNKVMPSKNSPTNKIGIKSNTMQKEYIVIFSKE